MTSDGISRVLTFAENRLAQQLYGEYDQHLALIQEALSVRLRSRGNQVVVEGAEGAVQRAEEALQSLYRMLEQGQAVDAGTVRAALKFAVASDARIEGAGDDVSIATRKRRVRPRTPAQADYIRAIRAHKLTFALGPAGTGKTYLAVAAAVAAMAAGEVERLILSRPAVEAGERIGFLPGDMKEKVDPYLRPLYDALHDMLPGDLVQRQIDAGTIEIAPLAFMRGRTLAHAFVILDEAQNTSVPQMLMFLTRFGEGARMVVCGDPNQVDLPAHTASGLIDAVQRLDRVDEVAVQPFTAADVVRDPLVSRIVSAYSDRRPAGQPGRSESPGRSAPAQQNASRGGGPTLSLDIAADCADWVERLPAVETRVAAAAQAAWAALAPQADSDAEVSILLGDDLTLADLNQRFRGAEGPTNVLAFESQGADGDGGPRYLGDIAIAFETVAREAIDQDKTLDQHLCHMVVHGLLHLLGYDHQSSAGRNEMEAVERNILAEMGVPDPYDGETPNNSPTETGPL